MNAVFKKLLYFYVAGLAFSSVLIAVPANTLIQNMVSVDYQVEGNTFTENSNVVSFFVDEIIVFTLIPNNATGLLVASPQFKAPLSYTLTNQGNGSEDFVLSESQLFTDEFNTTNVKIYLDTNNNNTYEDGVDVLYTVGSNDPILASGASLNIFIVSDVPAGLSPADEADLELTATSKTGAGPSGSVYNGGGDGGVDAVMGPQGGFVNAQNKLIITSAISQLTKTQSIVDPLGGNNAIKNAIITYTLKLEATGSGTLTSVVIRDGIPAGTLYVAGSMQLNGVALTDVVDSDEGVFESGEVKVSLASVVVPSTQFIQFSVRVQ